MTWKDPVYRAVRTFVQAWIATFLLLTVAPGTLDVPSLDGLARTGLAAAYAGGIAFLSFVHNWLEDNEALPPFLK